MFCDERAREPPERDSRVARLTALAARQHGLVSWNQLQRLGFDKDAVSRLRTKGWLHHLARNVYAVGHTALSPSALMLAGVMTYGPVAHLSDASAVVAHGMFPPWEDGAARAPVHVTVPPDSAQLPCVDEAELNVTFAGSVSVTTTFCASGVLEGTGPLFTVML